MPKHNSGKFAVGGKGHPTHGMSNRTEYTVWKSMISRCYNPNTSHYGRYGGRGITICDEWRKSFPAFLEYVGDRPFMRHQIDRIDNDGNYEPGNVRWVTRDVQAKNKGFRTITHNGKTQTISQWAEELKMLPATIRGRIRSGVTGADLFSPEPQYTCFVDVDGEKIKAARERAGLSRPEAAATYGCTYKNWWYIERPMTYRLKEEYVKKIAVAIRADPSEFCYPKG